jgi:hypothetical protein
MAVQWRRPGSGLPGSRTTQKPANRGPEVVRADRASGPRRGCHGAVDGDLPGSSAARLRGAGAVLRGPDRVVRVIDHASAYVAASVHTARGGQAGSALAAHTGPAPPVRQHTGTTARKREQLFSCPHSRSAGTQCAVSFVTIHCRCPSCNILQRLVTKQRCLDVFCRP